MKLTAIKHTLGSCFIQLLLREMICVCVCFKDTLTLHYKWNIFENLVCKLVLSNLSELFHSNNDRNRNRTNQLEMRQRLFSPCPFCLTQSPGIPEALWPRGRWERTDCSGGRSRNSSGGSSFYLGQGCARARCTTKAPEGTCLLLRQLFSGFCQPLHRILLLSDKLMKWTSSPG